MTQVDNTLYKKLELEELFNCQEKLDNYIREKKGIKNPSLAGIVNALLVELGEFLNEVRAFKHWSVKGMSKELAFEEYVDGLHFLLSVGNLQWEFFAHAEYRDLLEINLNNLRTSKTKFIYDEADMHSKEEFILKSITLFNGDSLLHGSLEEYISYFYRYIQLGKSIGMTETDMMVEYMKKHEKNYVRQQSGTY